MSFRTSVTASEIYTHRAYRMGALRLAPRGKV